MAAREKIFSRLKRLFSSDVIVRNIGGKKIKIVDTDTIQAATTWDARDKYRRLFGTSARDLFGYNMRENMMAFQSIRLELLKDYDTMDSDPIIASCLDIYADEATTKDEMGNVLDIRSDDSNIKSILDNLFYDILNVNFNLWSWTRNLCKYGDLFLYLDIAPEYGIVQVRPVSTYYMTRIEGSDPKNPNYIKFKEEGTGANVEYENYQIAHFRLLSDANYLPYGKAMVENARRVWKQVCLMEDAMLIHRVMRAPEKRVFKVDVGNIPPNEVDAYMEALIAKMKKVPFIDPQTGDYNLRFNLQNMTEDFFLPVRGGESGTSIDTLSGMEYNGIADIDYLKNKLMAALKIPKAYFGYEEDLSGKSTLAGLDIRFARTIDRIQRILVSELVKIAIVHLYTQGFTDDALVNFELSLTVPSIILEQEKMELMKNKMDVAQNMMQSKLFDRRFIYKKVFNISDMDRVDIENGIISDLKDNFRYNQIEQQGNDPAVTAQIVDPMGGLDGKGGAGGMLGGSRARPPGLSQEYKSPDERNLGRDPLGNKEMNSKERESPVKPNPRKTGLSAESFKNIDSIVRKKQINESRKGRRKISFLDEDSLNLL